VRPKRTARAVAYYSLKSKVACIFSREVSLVGKCASRQTARPKYDDTSNRTVHARVPSFSAGGTGTHVQELVQGLRRYNCTTHVFSFASDSAAVLYTDDRVRIRDWRPKRFSPLTTLSEVNARGAKSAAEIYSMDRCPHIVHGHSYLAQGAAEATRDLFRVPLISTVHGLVKSIYRRLGTPPPEALTRSEAALCHRSDYLITVSKAMRQDIQDSYMFF